MLVASETWLPVAGWAGYEVSDRGRVRSVPRVVEKASGRATHPEIVPITHAGRLLKPTRRLGYETVHLRRRGRSRICRVHTLVLTTFVGPRPPGTETRHLDGVRHHNWLSNLCWGTPAQNAADRAAHGTLLRGERVHKAKIREADAAAVKTLYGTFITGKLAQALGVGDSQVRRIALTNWLHVPPASWEEACAWYRSRRDGEPQV